MRNPCKNISSRLSHLKVTEATIWQNLPGLHCNLTMLTEQNCGERRKPLQITDNEFLVILICKCNFYYTVVVFDGDNDGKFTGNFKFSDKRAQAETKKDSTPE